MICCYWALIGKPIKLTLFLIVLVDLTACGLLESGTSQLILGNEETLVGAALLVCGRECSERGQCGQSDQGEMVLLNSEIPATFGHDMAFPEGTMVEIVHKEVRTAVQLSDSELFPVSFYLVNQPEHGQGWVAGWCIGQ